MHNMCTLIVCHSYLVQNGVDKKSRGDVHQGQGNNRVIMLV